MGSSGGTRLEAPGGQQPREYRCPVCGHVDEVELEEGRPRTVRCTHCETSLTVRLPAPDAQRLEVQVAPGQEPADR